MAYKCFFCGKEIKDEYIKKKVRCIYCGSKIIFKERTMTTHVGACWSRPWSPIAATAGSLLSISTWAPQPARLDRATSCTRLSIRPAGLPT